LINKTIDSLTRGASGLWDLGKTPIRISTLDALLENYPITEDKIKLSEGFKTVSV
jgi:hypothetical protein